MQDIKISVYCLAYNCEKFIDRAINGMLNQNIDVNYKIIIHDDASTDGTTQIIRKYAEMYPERIYAILQTENQYSKGVSIYKQYIEPNIEGDYIAICEGDDYWTDKNKLQLQYDYMESHPACSICTHNTESYDLETGKKKKFNNWKDIHIFTADEIFLKYCVHTSSYFIRRSCKDWPGGKYWNGDFVTLAWAFFRGQVVSMPQVMSVYTSHNPNGVMKSIYCSSIDKIETSIKERIKHLEEYNRLTEYRFDSYIQKALKRNSFRCIFFKCNDIISHSSSRQEIINAVKKVISHEYYKEYINEKTGIKRLLIRYKYEGYIVYPLWKIIIKNYLKNRL